MSRHDAADLSAAIRTALAKVIDPELRRPITELGMVKSIDVERGGGVHVTINLTTASCPKKTEITDRVSEAVADVPGTGAVKVLLDVMNDEQRTEPVSYTHLDVYKRQEMPRRFVPPSPRSPRFPPPSLISPARLSSPWSVRRPTSASPKAHCRPRRQR